MVEHSVDNGEVAGSSLSPEYQIKSEYDID